MEIKVTRKSARLRGGASRRCPEAAPVPPRAAPLGGVARGRARGAAPPPECYYHWSPFAGRQTANSRRGRPDNTTGSYVARRVVWAISPPIHKPHHRPPSNAGRLIATQEATKPGPRNDTAFHDPGNNRHLLRSFKAVADTPAGSREWLLSPIHKPHHRPPSNAGRLYATQEATQAPGYYASAS